LLSGCGGGVAAVADHYHRHHHCDVLIEPLAQGARLRFGLSVEQQDGFATIFS
jgi:hypothetical protein